MATISRTTDSHIIPLQTIAREGLLALAVIVPILLAAVVLTGVVFSWTLALIGAPAVFSLMLLISTPAWLASIEDDMAHH